MVNNLGRTSWMVAYLAALSISVACDDRNRRDDDDDDDGSGGTGGVPMNFQASCDVPGLFCSDQYNWSESALESIETGCASNFQGTWSSLPCSGSYCGTCSFGNSSYGITADHYVDSCTDSIKQACANNGGIWFDE